MLTLYIRLIWAQIRSQMQYKLSFTLDIVSFGIVTALEFVTIALVLLRFPEVGGWQLGEVALLYGLTAMSFSVAEMVGRGFDSPFERLMAQGAFDMVLTRPLNSFVQILASQFQLKRLGRSVQGLLAFTYGVSQVPIHWTLDKILILPITVLSGGVIFTALIVIGATVCFWTIKTPEVINIFTFGGHQLTSYPLHIYEQWIRFVFLAIVPVAFANYPATLLLLDRSGPEGLPNQLAWGAPLVAAVFFGLAYRFWNFGVSKYQSTGS